MADSLCARTGASERVEAKSTGRKLSKETRARINRQSHAAALAYEKTERDRLMQLEIEALA